MSSRTSKGNCCAACQAATLVTNPTTANANKVTTTVTVHRRHRIAFKTLLSPTATLSQTTASGDQQNDSEG
jgi:hypothetical protein